MDDVWATVAAERTALADLLETIDEGAWDKPSLCSGWRVRDVVAHLVAIAEAGNRYTFLLRHATVDPRPNKAIEKVGQRLAATTTPAQLTARLRAAKDGRFVVPGLPPVFALGEVLVHRADIAEAAGLPRHAADDAVKAVLEAELRFWFVFGVSRSMRRNQFVASDADWSVGPPGGTRVDAPGEELLLIACGRKPVA